MLEPKGEIVWVVLRLDRYSFTAPDFEVFEVCRNDPSEKFRDNEDYRYIIKPYQVFENDETPN